MHVGFDGRILLGPQRGMARYTRALLRALTELAPEHKYSVYVDHPVDLSDVPDVVVREIPDEKAFWASRVLPKAVKDDGVHIMHFPANTCWVWPACPTVVSLHDVNPLLDGRFGWRNRLLYVGYLTAMSYGASVIITPTMASKRVIERVWPFLKGRIRRVHYGMNTQFAPNESKEVKKEIDQDYVFFVGGCDPNKNLLTLLQAMVDPILDDYSDFSLAIAGHCASSGYGREVQAFISHMDLDHRITWLGWIRHREKMARLYHGAQALVFPSVREGFGIPVLESMSCDTPVIASNTTSIPEVAGDAALLVDPEDSRALAQAIARVLEVPELADSLRRKGRERVEQFSWERTARQTLETYQSVLSDDEE